MQIETKVNLGDEIYFMENNKEEPTKFGAKTVITKTYQTANTAKLDESQIFLTKRALLESL